MPARSYHEMRAEFSEPLPETGADARQVIRQLAEKGEPGLMQMVHPRFFGWVLGASHPAGVAADWLASAWGQNTGYHTPTPTTAAVEEVAAGWLLELLDLPREASVGFVTGASAGNFVALAAARNRVLSEHGWDSNADGLFGAPEIHVFIGDDAHTSVFSALQFLGMGLPSDFVRKGLLLLRSGYVRELAAVSYPHIQCSGGDFPGIAGGGCGERRLA